MKRAAIQSLRVIACAALLTGCADAEPNVALCLEGHTYGFWGGLWHGFICFWSFIGSLFIDEIAVWAPNNNGAWYAFGFLLGAGCFVRITKG